MQHIVVETRERVRRVFYGWWIVGAGTVINALNGGLLLHGFTVYFVFLQRDFGWSRTLLSGAYSFTRIESAFLGPLQGWMIDRLGPRPVTVVGLVGFGLGFILFSRVDSLVTFYISFIVMAIGSSVGGMLAITTSVVNWFLKKRTLAVGITMSGIGLGSLVLVPLLAWSLTKFGWQDTALASGVLIWVVGIPAALLIRHRPEDYGYRPDGVAASPAEDGSVTTDTALSERSGPEAGEFNFTAREAMKTPAFWLLGLGHGSALLAVAAVNVHVIPHMVDQAGLSVQAGAWVVALLSLLLVVGQIGGGYIGDRMNKLVVIVVCMFGHAIGLWLLAYATSVLPIVLFTLFHGLAWGIRGPLTQSIRADYFGPAAFATIMGFSSFMMMGGFVLGPIVAGALADHYGDYQIAFALIGTVAGLGSLLFVFARKPMHPVRHPLS